MRRREFITLLGGAAAGWPLALRAQQPPGKMLRVGYSAGGAEDDPDQQARRTAFLDALAKLGWVDGRNIRIDYSWGVDSPERERATAVELVGLAPNLILASGGPMANTLRRETHTIPIV